MNAGAALLGVKFDIREEYAIEYLEEILKKYIDNITSRSGPLKTQ